MDCACCDNRPAQPSEVYCGDCLEIRTCEFCHVALKDDGGFSTGCGECGERLDPEDERPFAEHVRSMGVTG